MGLVNAKVFGRESKQSEYRNINRKMIVSPGKQKLRANRQLLVFA